MAGFTRFEDINAWKKARELTRKTYLASAGRGFERDFALRDQIRRSAISVMANIAEGFGRRTNKDFANFLTIARGSAAETQSHLYIALDLGYLTQDNFNELYTLTDEVSRMIMALSKHLRRSA